jgi:hypothetical protein
LSFRVRKIRGASLFDLAKSNMLPGWTNLLGTLTLGRKKSPGLQAADLLAYASIRLERDDHGDNATDIEKSPHVLVPGDPAPTLKCLRIPVMKDSLDSLQADFLLPQDQRVNMQSR